MQIKKLFFLALYYGFAYHLPPTNSHFLGKMGGGNSQLVLSQYCQEMRLSYKH